MAPRVGRVTGDRRYADRRERCGRFIFVSPLGNRRPISAWVRSRRRATIHPPEAQNLRKTRPMHDCGGRFERGGFRDESWSRIACSSQHGSGKPMHSSRPESSNQARIGHDEPRRPIEFHKPSVETAPSRRTRRLHSGGRGMGTLAGSSCSCSRLPSWIFWSIRLAPAGSILLDSSQSRIACRA